MYTTSKLVLNYNSLIVLFHFSFHFAHLQKWLNQCEQLKYVCGIANSLFVVQNLRTIKYNSVYCSFKLYLIFKIYYSNE